MDPWILLILIAVAGQVFGNAVWLALGAGVGWVRNARKRAVGRREQDVG